MVEKVVELMIKIRSIRKKDYRLAREFAIRGMHFNWYMKSKLVLNLYSRYFWDLELTRATRVYGAYVDGKFVGCLLAVFKNEQLAYRSFWRKLYVSLFNWLQHQFGGTGVDDYDRANAEMLASYEKTVLPDGELAFLAAEPNSKIKGIGTALLAALETDEPGKEIFLFTDSACTYQFYEHRGFDRYAQRKIVLNLKTRKVPLWCFLYRKRL